MCEYCSFAREAKKGSLDPGDYKAIINRTVPVGFTEIITEIGVSYEKDDFVLSYVTELKSGETIDEKITRISFCPMCGEKLV